MANYLELALQEIEQRIKALEVTREHLKRALGMAPGRRTRILSDEAKAKIREAQQRRWAASRAEKAGVAPAAPIAPSPETTVAVTPDKPPKAMKTVIKKAKGKKVSSTAK